MMNNLVKVSLIICIVSLLIASYKAGQQSRQAEIDTISQKWENCEGCVVADYSFPVQRWKVWFLDQAHQRDTNIVEIYNTKKYAAGDSLLGAYYMTSKMYLIAPCDTVQQYRSVWQYK